MENACFRHRYGHNANADKECFNGDRYIAASNETMLLAVRFKVEGSLRFLSHAETLRLLQRACVRAGLALRYSEGFNPHPKFSLPLPRPVGVESEDELLCLWVEREALPDLSHRGQGEFKPQRAQSTQRKETIRVDSHSTGSGRACSFEVLEKADRIMAALASQLPEGCALLSVGIPETGASFQPRAATYVLPVKRERFSEELKATAERLLASEHLPLRRPTDDSGLNFKNVDVRGFLKSIKLEGGSIIVECEIRPDGSVRVDELRKLLGLDEAALAAPIRRTNVQWHSG